MLHFRNYPTQVSFINCSTYCVVFIRKVRQLYQSKVGSLLTLAMVFIKKIDPETHAYIKYSKNVCVKDLMKKTNVSHVQIYRIRKEPL